MKGTLGQLHLFFVRRVSSLGGAKCIKTIQRIYFGLQAVSFVERFIVLCPYFGESTIRGSTVFLFVARPYKLAELP